MKLALFLLLFKLGYAAGFLLDVSSPSPLGQTSITDKHFVTVIEFLSEEKQLRRQLEQMVGQLQLEVIALKQQIASNYGNASVSVSEVASLKNEIHELANSNVEVRLSFSKLTSEHATLKLAFETQTRKIQSFQNLTEELNNEVSRLKSLQSMNQAVAIHNVQQNVSSLSSRTARLESLETARQQDIIAINKQVTASKNDIINVQTTNNEFRNNTTEQLNTILTDYAAFAKTTSGHLTDLSVSLDTLSNKTIATLQKQITNSDRKVAFTACNAVVRETVVMFLELRTVVGITNITGYTSSGLLTCEYPGIYHISATIMTDESNRFSIFKNNNRVGSAYTGQHSTSQGYYSSTVVGAVELDVGDTVHIDTENDLKGVYGVYNCLTIIKVN